MMKKIILVVIIMGLVILVYFLYFTKNKPLTSYITSKIVEPNNLEVKINIDNILKNDISDRLNYYTGSPYKTSDNDSNCDISLSLDKNICNLKNKDEIYSITPIWTPKNLDELFTGKIPVISINYAQKNENKMYSEIKEYLKNSYTNSEPQKTTLIFTGDILPTRWVSKIAHDNNDMSYPFRETYEITRTADYTIGDLECPFAETGPYQELGTVFRGDPELVEGLSLAGIDVVNLANNHLGDSQRAGMNFTFNLLKDKNIGYFGAGINQTEAHKPYIKEVNGIKIAILGYADQDFTPTSYEADDEYAGLNLMNIDKMQEDVKIAKSQADFVIVSMHAGTEYTYDPDPDQIEFAKAAIDAGADMIYGHHPHVVQAIEVYNGKPIFYSLGNFAMDQIEENTRQGYLLQIKLLYNKISDIKLMPYHIYNWSQPKLVDGDEYTKILNDISEASKKLQ